MIVAKFNTTKTVSGSSSSSQLQLPFSNSGTYNCVVDWGDGSTDTITSWNQAETLHTYTTAGEYTVEITGPCPGFQTYQAIDGSKLTEVISFDCALVGRTNMANTFRDAANLIAGGSITGTSSVTDFAFCWSGCSSMTQPPDTSSWDTSSVTRFDHCWNGCSFRSHDYDRLLNQLLASSPRSGVPMHGGSSKYTYQGKPSRDALLAIGWNISDNGIDPNWPDPRFTGIGRQRRLGT